MAKNIKQKSRIKDVRTIDRAALLSSKMRKRLTKAKADVENAAGEIRGDENPSGYAEGKISASARETGYRIAGPVKRLANGQSCKPIGFISSGESSNSFSPKGDIKTNEYVRRAAERILRRKSSAQTVPAQNPEPIPVKSQYQSESIAAKTKQADVKTKPVAVKSRQIARSTPASNSNAIHSAARNKAVRDSANRKMAQQAAKKQTARTARRTKEALRRMVKAITAALKSLAAAIGAIGSVAVFILVFIILIGAIAASPFGIGFSGEETPGIVSEIEQEYSDTIAEIISKNAHDELEITGRKAPWRDVLAVYAVRMSLSANSTLAADEAENNSLSVAAYTDKQKQELKKVFWDMNKITHKTVTEKVSVTAVTPSGLDERDWEVGETTTKAITVLKINTAAKSCDDMAGAYNFTDEQNIFLAELLTGEGSELLDNALYGIDVSGGSGNIVEIAKQYIGNRGGEIFWRYMGFNSRVAWCACFVSYCANEAGYIEKGIIPKYASCEKAGRYSYIPWLKQRNLWREPGGYTPNIGDLIFFDWDGDSLADHIGIVEYVKWGTVHTIEGNSSDIVARRSYSLHSASIKGYGAPNY